MSLTILATTVSAILSLSVTWLLGLVLGFSNDRVHLLLAFGIPCFIAPLFSYLTALSMRDLQRARSHSRDLAALAELERTYLHSAVNNMPIGLVLFDANKRLIVCNDQYRSMYALPLSVTQRGSHLREMLEHRLGIGSFEGSDREAYLKAFSGSSNGRTRMFALSNSVTVESSALSTTPSKVADGWEHTRMSPSALSSMRS